MPTFHVYWADRRPSANQRVVADAVSKAMAAIPEAMISGPSENTFWFHRFRLADLYKNGVSLDPAASIAGTSRGATLAPDENSR
jgi:hypothetical protein